MRIALLYPHDEAELPVFASTSRHVVENLLTGLTAAGVECTPVRVNFSDELLERGKVPLDAESFRLVSELFEQASAYDLIHNHCGVFPLSYGNFVTTPILTTIYGPPSPAALALYQRQQGHFSYTSLTNAHRAPGLYYTRTIYPGLDDGKFTFQAVPKEYLLCLARIRRDEAVETAIEIARRAGMPLVLAGEIEDQLYFRDRVYPLLDDRHVRFVNLVNNMEKQALLGNARALLLVAGQTPPFTLEVMKALVCGTPVVSVGRHWLAEVIEHGRTGFLSDDAASAVTALQGIGSIDRAVCRASISASFGLDRMVASYLETYREVLAKEQREEHRPWGYYSILEDGADHKVKRIVVSPGKRLSLQRHRQRAEHWYIVSGDAVVTLEDRRIHLSANQAVDIPLHAIHRIENLGTRDVVFIEVQTGSYFGEDDIERLEDDFGRS